MTSGEKMNSKGNKPKKTLLFDLIELAVPGAGRTTEMNYNEVIFVD